MFRGLAMFLLVLGLVACSQPSATPPRPPTVNLTGTWQVTVELGGIVFAPFIWVIAQSGSEIVIHSPNVPDVPPCGEERGSLVGDRWTSHMTFNPSNCPLGFAGFQSGTASSNIRIGNTTFGGSITITATAPSHLAGTYRGSIRGVRQ